MKVSSHAFYPTSTPLRQILDPPLATVTVPELPHVWHSPYNLILPPNHTYICSKGMHFGSFTPVCAKCK